MAKKIEALEWKAFMGGTVKPKEESKAPVRLNSTAIAAVVIAGITLAQSVGFAEPAAVPAMAASEVPFQQALSTATKPIKDLIYGAGHEIYGVFMAWGAIEVMIGKPAQGFTRMKTATLAYILLWWVPWIVNQADMVRPR